MITFKSQLKVKGQQHLPCGAHLALSPGIKEDSWWIRHWLTEDISEI